MSRSYKKHPCATMAKTKGMKKLFNRKIRKLKDPDAYSNYKKKNCSWDICDYKCIPDKPISEMSNEEKKDYLRK